MIAEFGQWIFIFFFLHTAVELVLICHVIGVRVDSLIDSDGTSSLLDLFKM